MLLEEAIILSALRPSCAHLHHGGGHEGDDVPVGGHQGPHRAALLPGVPGRRERVELLLEPRELWI